MIIKRTATKTITVRGGNRGSSDSLDYKDMQLYTYIHIIHNYIYIYKFAKEHGFHVRRKRPLVAMLLCWNQEASPPAKCADFTPPRKWREAADSWPWLGQFPEVLPVIQGISQMGIDQNLEPFHPGANDLAPGQPGLDSLDPMSHLYEQVRDSK